ncbi:MAG: hypothetical protein Q4B87_01085 [Candidatus Saccharibacteria bacterium]|nr:hypothetical protein [Candidatus Saccharibacteria bacterium]
MSKVVQSVRNASNMHRLVRRFRNPVSFSRHSSISFTSLMVLMGFSLLSFAGISGVLLGSSAAYADESVRYDVNVNSSLTLGFSANTVSLNLNPGSKTFASQDITTTVSTNNQYGYDLYVTSDGTDLINQTDNTKTISTLPAKEGGYDTETFLADKWGVMKNNTSYQPFVSGATVSQSSTVTNADNTVLTFGAKTSYNTAPGNYKLLLTFQLIPRVATNDLTINFGGSGVAEVKVCKVAGNCTGDDLVGRVTTGGGSVPGLKDGSTYYLYPIFSSGYEFVSWAKNSSDASVISDTTILNPTFTMSDEPASVTVTGKSSCQTTVSGTMQDFKPCDSVTIGTTGNLTDSRDSESYKVGKLADGNWWLLDNLRLGSTSAIALTPDDTNIASDWTLPASGTQCFYTSSCTGTDGTTTGTGYTVPAINVASKNNTTTDYGVGSGKIGVYYNYCAASAGTYCMASSSDGENASSDICPKGWKMPTGDTAAGSYYYLYNTGYSANVSNFRAALSTPLSGLFYNGSAYSQGSSGYFWSSTRYSTTNMYSLYVGSSSVYPQGSYGRYYGFSVRCILGS